MNRDPNCPMWKLCLLSGLFAGRRAHWIFRFLVLATLRRKHPLHWPFFITLLTLTKFQLFGAAACLVVVKSVTREPPRGLRSRRCLHAFSSTGPGIAQRSPHHCPPLAGSTTHPLLPSTESYLSLPFRLVNTPFRPSHRRAPTLFPRSQQRPAAPAAPC